MAKFIIDTSSWLDLTKPKFSEVFYELEEQVKGPIVILTCDIIINEWKRNKTKVLADTISSIKSHSKAAFKLTEFIDTQTKFELTELIDKIKLGEKEQEEIANNYINRVEKLLFGSTIYKISDKLKLDMAERAIHKQAPFHNSFNNMADALLYFGGVEYVEKNVEIANDIFFVTSNKRDFCDPADPNKIHPDLYRSNVHFSYDSLALALKMRKELVDEMDEYHEYQLWNWIESEAEIRRGK